MWEKCNEEIYPPCFGAELLLNFQRSVIIRKVANRVLQVSQSRDEGANHTYKKLVSKFDFEQEAAEAFGGQVPQKGPPGHVPDVKGTEPVQYEGAPAYEGKGINWDVGKETEEKGWVRPFNHINKRTHQQNKRENSRSSKDLHS